MFFNLMSANGALLAAPPMSPGPAPGRAERGPAGPAGQPMYKGGASDDNQKSLKKVAKVRQNFPESWIWTETETKYI